MVCNHQTNSNKATPHLIGSFQCKMEAKSFLNFTLKHFIKLACLFFVVFQGYKCFKKYSDFPQGTHVSFKRASSYPYPDITICPYRENEHFNTLLRNCNLTIVDYFEEAVWVGNNAEIPSCNDPEQLYESIGENIYWKIGEVFIEGFNSKNATLTYTTNTEFDYWVEKETLFAAKCLTFQVPENHEVWRLNFNFLLGYFTIFVTAPGDFVATYDYKEISIYNDVEVHINIDHEIFDVLDTDEHPCENGNVRDECIDEYVTEVSTSILDFLSHKLITYLNISEFDAFAWLYHTLR